MAMKNGMDLLLAFPESLITRCWPAQRVLMGRRCCKRLRSELLLYVNEVSCCKLRDEPVDAQAVAEFLRTVHTTRLSLTWKNCSGASPNVLLEGLERVMDDERKPELRSIHIIQKGDSLPINSKSLCEDMSMELEEVFLTALEEIATPFSWDDTGWGLAKLPSVLQGCTSLAHLRISDCGIANAAELGKALCSCSCLEVLDLSKNVLDCARIQCFEEALGGCSALAVLNLSNNSLGDEGITRIMAAVEHCTALRALKIAGTGICHAETVAAVGRACARFTALECLDLSEISLGLSLAELSTAPETTPETQFANLHSLGLRRTCMHEYGVRGLVALLPRCPMLRNLDLRCNPLDDKAAALLSACLATCRALSHLSLADCKLKAAGAKSLAAGLAGCVALSHLDLSYNSISDEGVSSLVAVLQCSERLRGLVLRSIKMTAAGTEGISTLLQHCSTLTRLDVSRNKFGAAGAAMLVPGLSESPGLAHLALKGTMLGGEGAAVIARALGQSNVLEHVDLAVNNFDDGSADRILAAAQACKRLAHIDVSGNPGVRQETEERFVQVLSARGVVCVVGEGNVDPNFY